AALLRAIRRLFVFIGHKTGLLSLASGTDLSMTLAKLQRRFAGVLPELPREGALIVEPVLVGDVGHRLIGLEQVIARRLHAGPDNKLLRAHPENLLKAAAELALGKVGQPC